MGCSNGADTSKNYKNNDVLPDGWENTIKKYNHLKKDFTNVLKSHPFYYYTLDDIDLFKDNVDMIQSKEDMYNFLSERDFKHEFIEILGQLFKSGAILLYKSSLSQKEVGEMILKAPALFYADHDSPDIQAEKKKILFEMINSTFNEKKFYNRSFVVENIGIFNDFIFEMQISVLLQSLLSKDEISLILKEEEVSLSYEEIMETINKEMKRIGVKDFNFAKVKNLCLNYIIQPIKRSNIINV